MASPSATVLSAQGGGTVTIPYTTASVAAAAQTALFGLSTLTALGAYPEYLVTSAAVQIPTVAGFGGVIDTVSSSVNLGILNPNIASLVDNSPSVLAVIGGTATTLVANGISSTGGVSPLIYQNQAIGSTAFLGGGNTYFTEVFAGDSSTIYVDSISSVPGSGGGAIVDLSTVGTAATINGQNNTLTNIIPGGTALFNAQGSGTVAVQVSAGATVPATIVGAGGVGSIVELAPSAGNAYIQPGSASFIYAPNPGATGSVTLYGGNIGAGPVAPTFTGTATVNGGTGYFAGGSGGSGSTINIMSTSTVVAATTLLGGGSGDILTGFGAGDLLIAGAGNESLLGGVSTLTGAGERLRAGSGSTFINGDAGGFDTISTGTGTATVNLGHGTTSASGNLIRELGVGGSTTINGFLSSPFPNHDTFVAVNGVTVTSMTTVAGTAGAGPNGTAGTTSTFVLSDKTSVTFSNTYQPVAFNGGTIS